MVKYSDPALMTTLAEFLLFFCVLLVICNLTVAHQNAYAFVDHFDG